MSVKQTELNDEEDLTVNVWILDHLWGDTWDLDVLERLYTKSEIREMIADYRERRTTWIEDNLREALLDPNAPDYRDFAIGLNEYLNSL